MFMNAIILCGGLSTRLKDITKNIPKILLPIGGRTVLDWQLAKLRQLGIREVVLAAGHLSEVLQREVGDERLGMHLKYAIESKRLGTGGAIRFAWQFVSEQETPTWILNGDILTTADFGEMVKKLQPNTDGVILGSMVTDASSYGTLETGEGGKLLSFKEKEGKSRPGCINAGMYLLTKQAQCYWPEREECSIEYDVFPQMQDLYVYQSNAPWVDIGVPERLEWARANWHIFEERIL